MEIGDIKWNETILKGAAELDVIISENQAQLMALHCKELVEWNRITNLTSITDPEEIAVKHVIDSLAPANMLKKQARIIDIGTGGGFPGIPLKILRTDLDVLLLDSSRKKISFLKQVIIKTGLKGISAVHSRAEDLSSKTGMAGSFDIAICRAFSSLENILHMASPFLKSDGIIIAMKGKEAGTEAAQFLAGSGHFVDLTIKEYELPLMRQERAIITIKRVSKDCLFEP